MEELLTVTGGRTPDLYELTDGSVEYISPDASAFREVVELKDDVFAAVQRILDERGMQAETQGDYQPFALPGAQRRFSGDGFSRSRPICANPGVSA